MGCVVDENNKVSCFKDSLSSTPCGDIYQAESDYFARCLLMPASEFKECAEFGLSLGNLSKYFAVPLEQVCARFDDLGIDYDSTQRRTNEN